MAQTLVRWVVEELEKFELGKSEFFSKTAIINHGDRLHKEELHKCASFWRGKENEIEKPIFDEWYNETFKTK